MDKRVLKGLKTKKRIIDCARALFHEKGYNSVSVDDIVLSANSSKGSFYTHFKSKEELIFHMVPLADEAYQNFLSSNIEYISTIEKISSFIRYVFHNMSDKIGLDFMSAIYSSQIKDTNSESFLTSSQRSYYDVFAIIIKEGIEKNELKAQISPEHTVNIFTTCIRGAIYDWCLNKGSFNLVDYGMEIMNIMIENIRVEKGGNK
jgi:hypothetical protein